MNEVRQQIETLVLECLSDALEEIGESSSVDQQSRIYGKGSRLNSMAVVSMVVDLETRLAEQLDIEISLTDERAMSQKRSPFRDVSSITHYITNLCENHET